MSSKPILATGSTVLASSGGTRVNAGFGATRVASSHVFGRGQDATPHDPLFRGRRRLAHEWHTRPRLAPDLAQPCASRRDRSLLVMMGSGVRVPASACSGRRSRCKRTCSGVAGSRRHHNHSSRASDGLRNLLSTPLVGVCRHFRRFSLWPRLLPARRAMQIGTEMAHAVVLRDVPWIFAGLQGAAGPRRAAAPSDVSSSVCLVPWEARRRR
jgi:hypothetical protein